MPKRVNTLFEKQDNVRLFNLLFRHQVYLEGVKSAIAGDYVTTLRELYKQFQTFLSQVRYTTLDQFTKGELTEFVRRFSLEQTRFYSSYTERLIKLLQSLLAADMKVTRTIFEDVTGKQPEDVQRQTFVRISQLEHSRLSSADAADYTPEGSAYILTPEAQLQREAIPLFGVAAAQGTEESNKVLWAHIINEPNPANGLLLRDHVTQFVAVAAGSTLAAIRQGYANGWTPQQTLQTLVGASETTFRDGLLARLGAKNKATVDTLVQHVSSNVQAAVASVFFKEYVWVAIMDSHTTLICRSRNGTIYIYGQGPLPPAHYGCRSKAVPRTGESAFKIPESYYAWLKDQSQDFQNDVLGIANANRLRSGSLSAKEFISIRTVQPLTISEFAHKIGFILGD